jgi:uncharacterized iron-regulated membrane protein
MTMTKRRSLSALNRKLHHWGSIIIAVQLTVLLVTGVLLLLKKEFDWIQPPTVKGVQKGISIDFDRILAAACTVPEAGIRTWADVDRLDVRPGKGMLKVRAKNRWEIQIDANTAEVLQLAYRRSDLIESIHDGSFFGEHAKLWVFLPSALVLIGLWITGMVLFFHPYVVKARKRQPVTAPAQEAVVHI